MLDLFSGLCGASQAMVERGWEVVHVELDPRFPAEHRDVRSFHWRGRRPDLVWCSPPCTEFSKKGQPGLYPNAPEPSMDLVMESIRVIKETSPRYWVIENVQGAINYINPILGPYRQSFGRAFYLWGNFPILPFDIRRGIKGYAPGRRVKHTPAERAEVPREISEALADSIERSIDLPLGAL